MELKLISGHRKEVIDISDLKVAGVFRFSPPVSPSFSPYKWQKKLKEFMGEEKKLLIIVNDGFRSTPTGYLLNELVSILIELDVEILVATGTHRAPTTSELKKFLGVLYPFLLNSVHIHNCNKKEELVEVGKFSDGTSYWVNRLVWEAKKILVITSVEPHYFAGFTGGRKSFLPGVAGRETIQANHSYALTPQAKILCLKGNPVAENMEETIDLLKEKDILSLQCINDEEGRIYFADMGDIKDVFYRCVEKAKEVFTFTLPHKYPIVVVNVCPPLNKDFYQSHKALENVKDAVVDGGIMILHSACEEGLGQEDFLQIYDKIKDGEVFREYSLGLHKAICLQKLQKMAKIIAVSNLKEDLWERVGIKGFTGIREALNFALEKKGKDAEIIFINNAEVLVPVLKN